MLVPIALTWFEQLCLRTFGTLKYNNKLRLKVLVLGLAWLHKRRLGWMPSFSAGPPMADRADPRQVHYIALTTSEGLVGIAVWVGWSGGGLGLYPLSFFIQSFTTGDFKVIGSLDDSLVPAIVLCSVSDPLVGVYVAGLEGLLQVILDLFFLRLLCLCGQMRACHTKWSLVGIGLPSLSHGRPSEVDIPGVWLQC